MHKILFVEDNLSLTKMVLELVNDLQHFVVSANSLQQAYAHLQRHNFDLLIVDRGLPDGDGLEIVDYVQHIRADLPVLILSEKDEFSDRVLGLEKGADDYVCKPFSLAELSLRIDKLLSKTKLLDKTALYANGLRIYTRTGQVEVDGKPVVLRRREFQILCFLIRHKNTVCTREMMLDHVWNGHPEPTQKTMDVYVRRIRSALGKKGEMLRTIRGFGYVIRDE